MKPAPKNAPPQIFDRAAYRARRARAGRKGGDIFLAEEAAAHIAERLATMNRSFERGLDLGSRKLGPYAPYAKHWTGPEVTVDEEVLPFTPASFDLVVSVLSLHAVNDLPGALVQIRRALKQNGLFIAALFGGETLNELRTSFAAAESELMGGASPRVAPFADVRDLGALLQRVGFAKPVSDVERTIVRYRELGTLFSDLRALGETNVLVGRRTTMLSRKLLAAIATEYASRFADSDGRLRATFDVVYLTGYAP
jgi:SAM-dependent methyltransferase